MSDGASSSLSEEPYGTAERLRRALEALGVVVDVHDGYGLALVSVWDGLVVWCNGDRFWWQAGWDEQCGRPAYASRPVSGAEEVARLVAARCAELRRVRFGERADLRQTQPEERADPPRAQAGERTAAPMQEPEPPQGPV